MTVIYCATWVFPGSSTVIEDGAVAVEGEVIAAVDRRSVVCEKFRDVRVQDFHEAVILPGLVNTHSHLELTAMRGLLDDEETDFGGWLKKLTSLRLERMSTDDLYVSAAWGAVEAARSGITCVGDASNAAFESMTALRDVGLRGTVFQESFGPDPNMARVNVAILEDQLSRLRSLETSLVRAGVSPHAPYTVSAPQLRLISEIARAEEVPLMMHAAESAAEELLMHEGKGSFAAGLAARGINWQTPGVSSIEYLRANGILDTRPLLAHCIRVDDADIDTLAATEARIAHCPKSNAKLGHGRAPLGKFLAKGVTVGFGTDSVASNNCCDLLEEARFATLVARLEGSSPENHSFLGAMTALRTATAGGASALGLDGCTGELRSGLQADLAVVSLAGTHQLPCYDPAGTLLFASSGRDVVLTVVAGREIFRHGHVSTVDEDDLRVRMQRIGKKLEHQE